MEAVVDRPEDLTASWVTEALRADGQDLTVASVTAQRVGTGQIGATFRVGLTYEGAAGPATIIAKLAAGDPAMRTLIAAGYAAEVGFYLRVKPSLEVDTPRCFYGALSEDRMVFTLLLEDIDLAIPGVQADGCSVLEAERSIANLVGLHAPRWNDQSLYEQDFLLRSDSSTAQMMGDVLVSATHEFVERYRSDLNEQDPATLHSVAEAITAWQTSRLDPVSVIHGDYRLDNLLFHPGGPRVTAVDWQTAGIGPPLRDVAYFLGTSLDTDQREAHEEQLLSGYHAGLVDRGIFDYPATACWDDYRLGQLQGPMITVIGCLYATGTRSATSDAMFVTMARRSCAAIRKLGSLELV